MLLGGPAIGLILGAHDLNAGALTIALALTPVAVAIGLSAFGSGRSEGVAGGIWPGLAAVTGLLLILVQPSLGNYYTDAALFLAPTLTGLGAALFETHPDVPAPSAALAGAAVLFLLAAIANAFAAGHAPHLSLLAIAYDGILALLSVLALTRLAATRWSSQFTWLPLLILLEGIVIVRPPVTARWLIGLALLAIASLYLLVTQDEVPPSEPPTLRN